MKFFSKVLILFSLIATVSPAHAEKKAAGPSEAKLLEAAIDTYIYGYSLVTMEYTRRVMTNVSKSDGKFAPMGEFAHLRAFPSPQDKEVTAPNADTLYSLAWLDVSAQPYVLSIPSSQDRYFLMPMLSGWTDVFQVPGKRTTGNGAQTYLITNASWKGEVPSDMVHYTSPTALVWILGRTYSTGTPEDLAIVHKFQDNLKLVPLASWSKSYTPPVGKVDKTVNMKTPPRAQVNALSGQTYFTLLATLLKNNPPVAADSKMVKKMEMLGLTPGKDFDFNAQSEDVKKALTQASSKGLQKIMAHRAKAGKIVNGWVYAKETGDYKTDYLQRSFITYFGLGANLEEDAIYPSADIDAKGVMLNGANKYVLHFKTVPPVDGFWSLTMYDAEYFFTENSLKRYNLNSRHKFNFNKDGSLDLYFQKESPGADKEANWLPAPGGNFNLMLRTYWPEKEMLTGKWVAPAVQKVK